MRATGAPAARALGERCGVVAATWACAASATPSGRRRRGRAPSAQVAVDARRRRSGRPGWPPATAAGSKAARPPSRVTRAAAGGAHAERVPVAVDRSTPGRRRPGSERVAVPRLGRRCRRRSVTAALEDGRRPANTVQNALTAVDAPAGGRARGRRLRPGEVLAPLADRRRHHHASGDPRGRTRAPPLVAGGHRICQRRTMFSRTGACYADGDRASRGSRLERRRVCTDDAQPAVLAGSGVK